MRLMAIILFGIFMLGTLVNAETPKIFCASKKGEHIYYGSDGQIFLTAESLSDDHIANVMLEHRPDDKYGSRERGVRLGKLSRDGRYIRFGLDGDAWCTYKITLPSDYRGRTGSFPLFLDAYCEENTNSSHRLSCKIK